MTGRPAQTWRKFTFSKTPAWSFWVGGVILSTALTERVSGHLPLTYASVRKIRTIRWTFGALLVGGLALWIVPAFLSSNLDSTILWVLLVVGFTAMLVGLLGLSASRRVLGPLGKLLDAQPGYYDRLIEIRNVHPAFVAAVQQHQHARFAQSQLAQSKVN